MTAAARRLALVTGGSRGVGRAITLALAGAGFDVAINYLRDRQSAESTAAEVERAGARCWPLAADVGDPAEVRGLIEALPAGRPLHALVHNAAIGTFKPLLEIRPGQLELTFRVNAWALLWLARASLSRLAAPGGRVVAISSTGGARVVPDYGLVGSSKAALECLARYLAVELAPRGVTVNIVAGGLVDTAASRAFPRWETMRDTAVERTPGGRIGSAADLAHAVRTIVCSDLDWMQGQTLVVDGGLNLI